MNKKQEARLNEFKRIFYAVKAKLDDGYIIYDVDDCVIIHYLYTKEIGEFTEYGYKESENDNCSVILFGDDPDYDDGMHSTMKEIRGLFKSWVIIHPKHFKRVLGLK